MWAHLDQYDPAYSEAAAMVNAVAANLEGEAAEWVTSLHNEDAPEMTNINAFLDEFRARFEDKSKAQKAEMEIPELKQGNRMVEE